jgi:hypothetical protein
MKIEKGIPIPDSRGGGDRNKYPFGKMEVGDSVFFDGVKSNERPIIAARAYGRAHGLKFAVRIMDGGARIWRVE